MAEISFWDKPVISYDLETTGLSPFPQGRAAEIIEIGAVKGDPRTFEVLGEFECKIFPQHIETASLESFEFNHYDPAVWVDGAKALYNALLEFADFSQGGVLLAQNHTFDWLFIQEASSRFGIDLKNDYGVDYHRLDLMSMSYISLFPIYEQNDLSSVSLGKVAEFLGIAPWEQHTALADAQGAWQIFCELLTRQQMLYEP